MTRGPCLCDAFAVVAALLAVACSAPGESDVASIVADSAGVRIEDATPRSAPLSLSEEPLLSIGTSEGDDRHVFGRVVGGLLLADGRVAVADGVVATIRVYDTDGRHLDDWGRRGSGPGEFDLLWSIHRFRGDSILAGESGARRVTVLDGDGAFGRVIRPRDVPAPPDDAYFEYACCHLWGALHDGRLLLTTPDRVPVEGAGPRWATAGVLVVREDGAVREVASLPSGQYRAATETDDPAPSRGVHYQNGLILAPWGAGFVAFDGLAYLTARRSATGILESVSHVARARPSMTPEMRTAVVDYYAGLLRRAGADAAGSGLTWTATRGFPDSLPAYNRVVADVSGRVWAAYEPSRFGESESLVDVFEADGTYVGEVEFPDDLRILDATRDRILVLHVGEMGVESVRVYGLLPSPQLSSAAATAAVAR